MRLRWSNVGGTRQDSSVGILRETNVLDSLYNLLFRLIYQDDIAMFSHNFYYQGSLDMVSNLVLVGYRKL